jgi:hypothetical protein
VSPVLLALWVAAGAGPAQGGEESAEAKSRMWEVLGSFDAFPGADPYPVADSMEVRGASFRSAGFTTTASAEVVAAFYRQSFKQQGMMVFDQSPDMTQFVGLSAFDAPTDTERTVLIFPGNGGLTRVILSLSSGHELEQLAKKPQSDQSAGLPLPEGVNALRSDSLDGARRTTSVSYHSTMESGLFVTWLQGELKKQSWVGESRTDDPAGQTLRYRRGSEALEVVLVTMPGGVSVTYLMLH